jgi:hypothetical protein
VSETLKSREAGARRPQANTTPQTIVAVPSGSSQQTAGPTALDFDYLLPAAHRLDDFMEIPTYDDIASFEPELGLDRLNNVHGLLWLAGRPMPPRPLHYQLVASREIFISEKMDMHLLWERNRIYLKPIPRYLLDHKFWAEFLICKKDSKCACFVSSDPSPGKQSKAAVSVKSAPNKGCDRRILYKNSLGFLLSYAALVQYESDFFIAKAAHLLPENMEWEDWRALVRQLLDQKNSKNINERFRFGELRLTRLNEIYLLRLFKLRGYMSRLRDYREYFHQNLAPIVTLITYIAIVLTAMQVGLATGKLQQNETFQQASYGFTIFSIVGPLALVFIAIVGFLVLFISNVLATLSYKKERFAKYDKLQAGAQQT